MQLTLKDAHRLETALNQKVEELRKRLVATTSMTVTAYDEALRSRIQEREDLVMALGAEARDLTTIRYRVRRAIADMNQGVGITGYLNSAAELSAQIRLIQAALNGNVIEDEATRYRRRAYGTQPEAGAPREPLSLEEIDALMARFEAVRANAGGAVAREDKAVIPYVLSGEQMELLQEDLATLKRTQERLTDQIGTLNFNTPVMLDLTEDQVARLQEHGIHYGAEG
jgi:hypothetical protein